MAAIIRPVRARHADELLDVVRVLLLLQGSILIATTVEAGIWGAAFRTGLAPAIFSGLVALALLVARARLAPDRRTARRVVFIVEGVLVATLLIDTALALLIRGAVPPIVAILTRLAIPLAVVVLLRRSSRIPPPTLAPGWGA